MSRDIMGFPSHLETTQGGIPSATHKEFPRDPTQEALSCPLGTPQDPTWDHIWDPTWDPLRSP